MLRPLHSAEVPDLDTDHSRRPVLRHQYLSPGTSIGKGDTLHKQLLNSRHFLISVLVYYRDILLYRDRKSNSFVTEEFLTILYNSDIIDLLE